MSEPGRKTITSLKELINIYSGIDKNLVHIVASGTVPFTDRGVLYLPSDMFSMIAGTIGSGGEALVGSSATAGPTITETNSATISSRTSTIQDYSFGQLAPTVSSHPTGSAQIVNATKRYGVVTATLVGGTLADVELVPAKAGYYGCMRILGVWSDTAGTLTATPQDEDDASLNPTHISDSGGVQTDCLEDHIVPFGASGANLVGEMVFYGASDNKALELDLAAAGTEKYAFLIAYWYET